jgi:UDP-N-acetylglucosamine:LPS N-acetylglucosamine transferase
MHRVSGGRLARFVRERRPDVVVSTHPAVTEGLGQLRRRGELEAVTVSAVTDLSALRYWASRGIDVHLITHPESEAEVRGIAGPATRIEAVHGLTDPAFLDPPSEAEARAALDLPAQGGVVAVSGGGWGVGDLDGAIRAALGTGGVAAVLCLCGRNHALRDRVAARFAPDPRVRALGFVERMVDVMAAADVLVHSTAGLTVLEAWMLGCRPISYGWGIGHVRLNNRAFRRFGIAEVVSGERELPGAIAGALAAPRVPRVEEFARLRSAAEVVLELARPPAGARPRRAAPPAASR